MIRIVLVTRHGPLSADILPDLAHYRDDDRSGSAGHCRARSP